MLDRFLRKAPEPERVGFGSVDFHLYWMEKWLDGRKRGDWRWEYRSKAYGYLQFAKQCGLNDESVAYSCFDLAASLANDPYKNVEKTEKIDRWNTLRGQRLENQRGTRVIEMNLDPAYFHAILIRDKSFEGRALDLTSDKDYPDIRYADIVRFNLKYREFWHNDEARQLGLKEGMVMEVDVGEVLFSPLVHWMYEFNWCNGRDFQPMISGPSELLYLQSAGVYYTFPGYPEKIDENGFVGIEVQNPRLLK